MLAEKKQLLHGLISNRNITSDKSVGKVTYFLLPPPPLLFNVEVDQKIKLHFTVQFYFNIDMVERGNY